MIHDILYHSIEGVVNKCIPFLINHVHYIIPRVCIRFATIYRGTIALVVQVLIYI